MKKILFGLSVFFTTLISAQNYPDYYPNNNNGYYDDYDDEFYFPEDYYVITGITSEAFMM